MCIYKLVNNHEKYCFKENDVQEYVLKKNMFTNPLTVTFH